VTYPSSLDELTDGVPSDGAAPTTDLGDATYPHDDHHRALAVAVEALEAELGTDPSGASATVAARIAATETVANAAVPKSTVTTAGDLIYGTGNAAVSRLGLGTAGYVLTAGASAPTWAAASGGTTPLNGPGLVSGWYVGSAGVIDTISMAANVAMYTAFPVERAVTVDRIGLNISAGVSGSTVRLGIYGDTGGLPGTLLVDAGTINSASTGYMEISISTALTVGRVWLCAVMQGGASPVTAVAVRFPFAGPAPTSGYSGTSGGGLALTTGPSGALPSTASTPNDIRSTPPRVMLRVV
jgi:hypothetical protein